MEERIQKLLSSWGVCSRRAAEKLIAEGRIRKNGHPVAIGDKADPVHDLLTLDGREIGDLGNGGKKYYIMLNKPRGYVTTAKDELGRRCVTDLVSELDVRLYPVGRLDRDSEGLLLLTNDGDFTNRITHPSHGVTKVYRVSVKGKIEPETELAFLEGVESEGELLQARKVVIVSEAEERSVVEITLSEGKNRHIRRLCEAFGLEVLRLKRIAEGGVLLGGLPTGKWRELTPQELATLKSNTRTPDERTAVKKGGRRGGRK